ncbi:MAG: alpha/beta hydrolase [Bacteriovoracia bacterium]
MPKLLLNLIFCFLFSICSFASEDNYKAFYKTVEVKNFFGKIDVPVSIYQSTGDQEIKADLIYIHGFGDQADNHSKFFGQLAMAGYRVIAFDLPSHGRSKQSFFNGLQFLSFERIFNMINDIEKETLEDSARPLVYAGWSTGGLILARMAQKQKFKYRTPQGLVLITPAVSIYKTPFSFGQWGLVTNNTLSNNLERNASLGSPKPRSPFFYPIFAMRMLWNSFRAYYSSVDPDIGTAVFIAGDNTDRYVKSGNLVNWIRSSTSYDMIGMQFDQTKHDLENEPNGVGEKVRELVIRFANAQVDPIADPFIIDSEKEGCKVYLAEKPIQPPPTAL